MPVKRTLQQLAQRMPTTTAATFLYHPPTISTTTIAKLILVCNNTASAVTFSIWVSPTGSTSGNAYAIYNGTTVSANLTRSLPFCGDDEMGIILVGNTASLLVQSSVANAITFTVYGVEVEQT